MDSFKKNRYLKKMAIQIIVDIFEVDGIALVSWRISSSPSYAINTPSIRFQYALFAYKYKTSAFVTGKCRLMVKSAVKPARMASIWRQNGVLIFGDAH